MMLARILASVEDWEADIMAAESPAGQAKAATEMLLTLDAARAAVSRLRDGLIVTMREAGTTDGEIARLTGVSRQRVGQLKRRRP